VGVLPTVERRGVSRGNKWRLAIVADALLEKLVFGCAANQRHV
jgi:hypothetical protein